MKLTRAKTFMRKAKNRELWFMEATGSFDRPLKTAYKEPYLYVQEKSFPKEIDFYDVRNICGECEDDITLAEAIKKFPNTKWAGKLIKTEGRRVMCKGCDEVMKETAFTAHALECSPPVLEGESFEDYKKRCAKIKKGKVTDGK